eukprot:28065-Pelagococcus_subviridis.AAC.1
MISRTARSTSPFASERSMPFARTLSSARARTSAVRSLGYLDENEPARDADTRSARYAMRSSSGVARPTNVAQSNAVAAPVTAPTPTLASTLRR